MSWRSWSLIEWNNALVTAVFLDQERLGTPICRINASDRFLATVCANDAECNPSEARKAFVAAFGKTARQIKKHFSWSDKFETQTDHLGIPTIFAQLYLTLLAAGADDATYDQGDFRKRFAELVKPIDVGQLDFRDLPAFWLHVQRWSKARARKSKDCRGLQLPEPPQHERRIGHSKRLAFPAYKDEKKLRQLLQDSNLDENSDFGLVTHAAYSRLSSFSANFVEELNVFKKFVADAKFLQAYESPFWGAVRDLSWEHAKSDALKNGSYCLGIDIIDQSHPELYLLTDSVGRDRLLNLCELSEVQSRDKYTHLASASEGRQWTPQLLDSIGRQNSNLRRSSLWKNLACGCIALFPDIYGNLTTQGDYFGDCTVCFIFQNDFAAPILSGAKFYGLKPLLQNAQGQFGDWQIVLFESVGRDSLTRLVQSLPEKIQGAIALGWRPPRPSLSGGAWFGQALLLNPASNPLVCMSGAISGEYELIDASDSVLISGRLDAVDSGFRIPPNTLVGLNGAATVRFILQGEAAHCNGEIAVPLTTDIPISSPILMNDRGSWLTDGRAGVLVESSTLLNQFKPPTVTCYSKRVASKTGRPRLQQVDHVFSALADVADLDDIPGLLDWLCEALSLRFQRRATLPFKELNIHISSAAEAVGVRPWLPRQLLLATGWLSKLQKRTSPYAVTAPGDRTIAINRGSDKPVVRIAGMLSRSERAKLRGSLIEGELVYRLQDRRCTLGVGTIELQLDNPSRIEQIANQFGLTILVRESFGVPVAATCNLANLSRVSGNDLPSTSNLQVWHEPKHEWVGYVPTDAPIAPGILTRLKGEQRYTYWAFGEGIYWKTDSDIWAGLFKLAVKGQTVGEIATNGDCRFHSQLMGIPQSLSRWWMHWGGGCISIDATGSLVFGGGGEQGLWDELEGWSALANNRKHADTGLDMALGRRKLALRLRALRSR